MSYNKFNTRDEALASLNGEGGTLTIKCGDFKRTEKIAATDESITVTFTGTFVFNKGSLKSFKSVDHFRAAIVASLVDRKDDVDPIGLKSIKDASVKVDDGVRKFNA